MAELSAEDSRVAEWKRRLDLRPHPEGGWFREVFGEKLIVEPGDGRGARRPLSVIYYLLTKGEHGRWHKVRSAEAWTLLDGGPLALGMFDAKKGGFSEYRLAANAEDTGAEPARVVPAGVWQAAYPMSDYALVACVVGPGFDWADFAWLKDFPEDLAAMRAQTPEAWRGLV